MRYLYLQKKAMLRLSVLFLVILFLTGFAPKNDRLPVFDIPDIPGYQTLVCDFHMHTVFSDGLVWPTVRVKEARLEGIDAIAITDHLELRNGAVEGDHNKAYELAAEKAKELDIICIRGCEITKSLPPGHFNAIFTRDNNKIESDDWRKCLKEARTQGAFIIWNHPGWTQAGEVPVWYPEHDEILKSGWMDGMEIVNERSYYPLAHSWCIEKKITMLGNSDLHDPAGLFFDASNDDLRPVTLVFAKERSAESIHEALKAGRTAVLHNDSLFGSKDFLEPLFQQSVRIDIIHENKEAGIYIFSITNASSIPLVFTAPQSGALELSGNFTLSGKQKKNIPVKLSPGSEDAILLDFTITNFITEPGKGLEVSLKVK